MTRDQLYLGTKTYGENFSKFCEPIKQFLDLDNEAYYNINIDGEMTNIHSNDKWMEEYIAGENYLQDPHMVHPNNIHKGFCVLLVNNYNYQKYNDVILYGNANKSLFEYGFTYVLKTNVDFTAFCFTTNKSNYIINRLINETKVIELFIKNLDHQIKSLLQLPKLTQSKIDLAQLKGERFFNQKGIIFYD